MNGCTCTFTIGAIFFILIWQLATIVTDRFRGFASRFFLLSSYRLRSVGAAALCLSPPSNNLNVSSSAVSQLWISEFVSDSDLKTLIDDLEEEPNENNEWDNVIDRRNNSISYNAKCCEPKDGPLKYLSVTAFENCSAEMLRDFYMDNFYRKQWDKTLIEHEQLQLDKNNGIEMGRTIKKFPLLTPREYILAWRVWVGKDGTFYCLSKGCEHPLAPRHRKYVRVGFFRSGWRIRKVAGRNACEIKMVHQEDAGLNMKMAKLAFAKGIWGYVCKMDNALRRYSAFCHLQPTPTVNAITLIQKVPPGLDAVNNLACTANGGTSIASGECRENNTRRGRSNKMIANGLIFLVGVICLSRGHSNLGTKVAMAYILSKLTMRGSSSSQPKQQPKLGTIIETVPPF